MSLVKVGGRTEIDVCLKTMSLLDLPFELLGEIVQYSTIADMANIACTCTWGRDAIRHNLEGQTKSFDLQAQNGDGKGLKYFLRQKVLVESIVLDGAMCSVIEPAIRRRPLEDPLVTLQDISTPFLHLKTLVARGTHGLFDSGIASMAQHQFPSLKILSKFCGLHINFVV